VTLLEKLLMPAQAQRVVEEGLDVVGGPVVRAEDVQGRTAAQRVAAYGLEGERFPFGPDPEFVDVLQFETSPLMVLRVPDDRTERPWPTYPFGFLRDATPVWDLDLTRVTVGARYVRIGRDGSHRVFSEYDGAARGWRGARGYTPPLWLAGPRATWHGLDLPASYSADQTAVELVWVGDEGVPTGFEQARPRIHARQVPVTECESVFEVVLTGRWRDAPVRVLQQAGQQALLLLSEPDVESVDRLGARAWEPSLFAALAPSDELQDVTGVSRTPRTAP
jgi:hypothetical protein